MKEMFNKYKYYLFIIIIAFIVCSPFTADGYVFTHDGYNHIARAYGTAKGIMDGQFLPIIISNFCDNFGYSWNLFYPPLSAYIPAIIKIVTPTFSGAMKITVILMTMLSGITMFNFMKEITKSKRVALITSIIYLTAPYKILDASTRLAIGEVFSLAFFPVLFHGLYNIFYNNGKKNYLLAIGAVGILLSHNISALFAVLLSGIYVVLHIKKLFEKDTRKNIWKNLIINVALIVGIVSFFYVPLLEAKSAAEYTVFQDGYMSNVNFANNHRVYIFQLLFGNMYYGDSKALGNDISTEMCFAIGFTILIPVLFSPLAFRKISKEKRKLYLITLILGLLFIIPITNMFDWSIVPKIFVMIQFPWRLIFIVTFLLTIIAGINIGKIVENIKMRDILILTIISLIYIAPLVNSTQIDFEFDEATLYNTDIIPENIADRNCASFEYLPYKVRENIDYVRSRENKTIITNGNAIISNEIKDNLKLTFDISTSESTVLELPYLYYPGYSVKINKIDYKTRESDKGFVEVEIPANIEGKVNIKYTGTTIMKITTIISIMSFAALIAYIIILNKKQKESVNRDVLN